MDRRTTPAEKALAEAVFGKEMMEAVQHLWEVGQRNNYHVHIEGGNGLQYTISVVHFSKLPKE